MSILRSPSFDEIRLETIVLRRFRNYPQYCSHFIDCITTTISKDYAEITSAFAESLIRIDQKGFDEFGYFSIGKDIWMICGRNSIEPLGYEVITRKRGGCIKIGPTFLIPSVRGKGYASKAIEGLLKEYEKVGARKVYVTAPLNHESTAILDFFRLKLKVEAILSNHYSDNSSERVCGRFLGNSREEIPVIPRVNLGQYDITEVLINDIHNVGKEEFKEFILLNMSKTYDDIDQQFIDNLIESVSRDFDKKYEEKGKKVFLAAYNSKLGGVSVATLKRGGVFKVAPFLVADDFITKDNVKRMLAKMEICAKEKSRRKITIFIAAKDVVVANILSNNAYICEGILREPYKVGFDMIVFSKFL